jgi:hypothetical protein
VNQEDQGESGRIRWDSVGSGDQGELSPSHSHADADADADADGQANSRTREGPGLHEDPGRRGAEEPRSRGT